MAEILIVIASISVNVPAFIVGFALGRRAARKHRIEYSSNSRIPSPEEAVRLGEGA